jgi:hypothetical protein
MIKRTVKSGLLSSILLAILACNSTIPNNTKISNQDNFQELDKEYVFKTKELTEAYLKRKLDTWLDTGSESPSPNGPKLVKEIAYARFKHPDLFCEIMQENENMPGIINSISEVSQRREIDAPFSDFIDSCSVAPLIFGEFKVNTFTENDQRYPDIAMDSSGDYVITWQSGEEDGNYHGIYAQRYKHTGEATGSEFQVNTGTRFDQTQPSAAMDDSGDFLIAWNGGYYNSEDNYYYGIFAQRYNSQGGLIGTEFQVNTYISGNKMYPAAAIDSDGDFVITWMNYGYQDEDLSGIFARRYNSDGTPLGTEFQVNTYTTESQYNPDIAMNSAGDFVITWMSNNQDGDGYGIYAQVYDPEGGRQGTEFRVNTFTTGQQGYPTAAMDRAGNFVISWYSDDSTTGIYAQKYYSDGSVNGSQFQVNTAVSDTQRQQSIAMNGNSEFVISWISRDQDVGGIFARKYDSTGLATESQFQVNTFTTGQQEYPSAAIDSTGDFVIIWDGKGIGDSYYGIFGQRYDSTGTLQ